MDAPTPSVDKLMLASDGDLHVIYTHRSPVSISGEDPVALYNYLQTPTVLRYADYKRALVADLEETQVA